MRVLEALIELNQLKGWATISELASVSEEKKLRVTQTLNLNKRFIKVDPKTGRVSLRGELYYLYPDKFFYGVERRVVSTTTGKIEDVRVLSVHTKSKPEWPAHLYENIGKDLTFDYLSPSLNVFAVRDTTKNRQSLRDMGLMHYTEFQLHDFWEEINP